MKVTGKIRRLPGGLAIDADQDPELDMHRDINRVAEVGDMELRGRWKTGIRDRREQRNEKETYDEDEQQTQSSELLVLPDHFQTRSPRSPSCSWSSSLPAPTAVAVAVGPGSSRPRWTEEEGRWGPCRRRVRESVSGTAASRHRRCASGGGR